MNILISLIKMIGGLVLLIYGMNILSTNLKKMAGDKLKSILKKATDNIFKGILTGIIITIAVQSSAIVTVMVVGFVNAEILKLRNAIPIIMGANIGTTITAQILRLASLEESSFLAILHPTVLAPIFIIIGFIFLECSKKQKRKDIGQLFIGIGLLFTGLMTMVNIASSFSNLPILGEVLSKLSNPILGVLAGAIVTAIVQSSAATVGILQAISQTGIITYASTIPIILGQNIGTCFTSILSSIGASKNAKRVATIHLLFNLIGTIIFLAIIYTYQSVIGFSFWNKAIDMGGIANFHLIFNVVCTIILIPCISLLEKIANIIVRDNKSVSDDESDSSEYLSALNVLDERMTKIPSIAISNVLNAIYKMAELDEKNLKKTKELLYDYNTDKLMLIGEREDIIDKMDVKIAEFLVKIGNLELSEQENKTITSLLKIESEFEKIGDYTFKLSKHIEDINEKELEFSKDAKNELNIIYKITEDILTNTNEIIIKENKSSILEIQGLKEILEIYRERFKKQHLERLKNGICTVDNGIAFIEMLNSFERIAGHALNISAEVVNYKTDEEYIPKHEYLNNFYSRENDNIKELLSDLARKYEILFEDNGLKAVKSK